MLLFAEAVEAGGPAGCQRGPNRGDPSPPRLHPPSCSGVQRTTAKGNAGVRELRPALSRERLRRAFARRGSHTAAPTAPENPRGALGAVAAARPRTRPATRPGLLRPPRRDESAPGWDRTQTGRRLRQVWSLEKNLGCTKPRRVLPGRPVRLRRAGRGLQRNPGACGKCERGSSGARGGASAGQREAKPELRAPFRPAVSQIHS